MLTLSVIGLAGVAMIIVAVIADWYNPAAYVKDWRY